MFDYLCIDWGQIRCGIAFGDSLSGLIMPYIGNIETKDLSQILEKEILSRKIKNIVIGKPTNFHMGNTLVTDLIEKFTLQLKKQYPELNFFQQNERNSSKNAKDLDVVFDKYSINNLAAMQILQSFFDKSRSLD